MTRMRVAGLLLAVLLIAACRHAPAPVEESAVLSREEARATEAGTEARGGQTHTVEKGDTLYSIAFRYGLDFRTLAALNGIRDPYTIYPGQLLTIKSRGKPVVPKPKPVPVKPAEAKPAEAKPVEAKVAEGKPAGGKPMDARAAEPKAPEAKSAGVKAAEAKAPEVKPAEVKTVEAAPEAKVALLPGTAASKPAVPAKVRVAAGGSWQWPAQGPLLGSFRAAGFGPKGIAIGGSNGDPVRAARDGRVVYIGDSLVGYGQLVIIKHDDVYLSAYAHNSRLLVKEGDAVRGGDVIAEMGSTGADRTKLHFEVRRNGDPVDPLSVLPVP